MPLVRTLARHAARAIGWVGLAGVPLLAGGSLLSTVFGDRLLVAFFSGLLFPLLQRTPRVALVAAVGLALAGVGVKRFREPLFVGAGVAVGYLVFLLVSLAALMGWAVAPGSAWLLFMMSGLIWAKRRDEVGGAFLVGTSAVIGAGTLGAMVAQSPAPASAPWIDHAAYDVAVVDGTLFLADREHLAAIPDQDGVPGELREVARGHYEHLLVGADGRSLYATESATGTRRFDAETLEEQAAFSGPGSRWPTSVAEDFGGDRVYVPGEWGGVGDVYDLAGRHLGPMDVPPAHWSFLRLLVDPERRVMWRIGMFYDGDLTSIDLNSGEVLQTVRRVYGHGMALNPETGEVYVARSFPGQIWAHDPSTGADRRLAALPLVRDVVYDPVSGDLFTNTYPFGRLLRIDAQTGERVDELACGWRCRYLHVDPDKRVLWAASGEGVFRFEI